MDRVRVEEEPGGGIYQYKAPGGGTLPARYHECNRWRPTTELPEVPGAQAHRTKQALHEQCMNARMPGYTGYVPSARAEDICARSQACVGRTARDEQLKRHERRTLSEPSYRPLGRLRGGGIEAANNPVLPGEDTRKLQGLGFDPSTMPEDHPLGKSKSTILRHHWIPTIPGYAGYIPGVNPENISGGGMSRQCRLAARALAEQPPRGPPLSDSPVPDLEGPGPRGFKDKDDRERAKLVDHLRDHCLVKIPGYMGYIPRVRSESMFGGTAANINRIAADHNEDRVLYPSDEGKRCHAAQVPDKRKLRM